MSKIMFEVSGLESFPTLLLVAHCFLTEDDACALVLIVLLRFFFVALALDHFQRCGLDLHCVTAP